MCKLTGLKSLLILSVTAIIFTLAQELAYRSWAL